MHIVRTDAGLIHMTRPTLTIVPPRPLAPPAAADVHRRLDGIAADHPLLAGIINETRRAVDKRTEPFMRWRFVMLGPAENKAVLDLIARRAKRPKVSIQLWGAILCRIGQDTGKVLMDRREMMATVGTKSSAVISSALAEFTAWGALMRHQSGRDVHWYVNPNVATHLIGAARSMVQRNAPEIGAPLLEVIEGGKRRTQDTADDDAAYELDEADCFGQPPRDNDTA